jgi:Domain of unknown function DUF29
MMGSQSQRFKSRLVVSFSPRIIGETGMPDVKTLYDEDFVAWSEQQAEALRSAARSGSNRKLDWENLAEEIESLGRSEKRELRSQLSRAIHHLLKLEYSIAKDPRQGWVDTVTQARREIELLLETSPSLSHELDNMIPSEMRRGAKSATYDLEKYGELTPALATRLGAAAYTPEQILGDWFPPEPKA